MNAIKVIKLASCALIVLASIHVYAQSSEAGGMAPATPMKQSAKAENHALSKKVRAVLVKTKGLHAENITVQAHGGTVLLDGTVPDASQVDLATKAAQGVAGVTAVNSHLSIKEIGQ